MFSFSKCQRGCVVTPAVLLVLHLVLDVRSIIIPSRDDGSASVIIRHVGQVIDEKDQLSYLKTKSECECRTNCQVARDRCRGYSFNKLSGACRLASAIHPGETEKGGVFVYTLQTGLPSGTKRLSDGLYYVLVSFANVTQAVARNRCSGLPGFRLAQAKSLQTMKIIKDTWYSNEAKLWRYDLRCGLGYPLAAPFEGLMSQCNPVSIAMCCSPADWCGNTPDHCECKGCKNYTGGSPRVNSGDFWIDLNIVPTSGGGTGVVDWSWGDGTALNRSLLDPNEPVDNGSGLTGAAIIASFKVQKEASDASHGYLCQANYDDVGW